MRFLLLVFASCFLWTLYVNAAASASNGVAKDVADNREIEVEASPIDEKNEILTSGMSPEWLTGTNRRRTNKKRGAGKDKKRLIPGKNRSEKGAVGSCEDKFDDCARARPFCKEPPLVETLKRNCPKTCDFCKNGGQKVDEEKRNIKSQKKKNERNKKKTANSEPTGDSKCEDSASTCLQWNVNGYCKTDTYTEDEKRKSCAKTCKLCGKKAGGGEDDKKKTGGTTKKQKGGKSKSNTKKLLADKTPQLNHPNANSD